MQTVCGLSDSTDHDDCQPREVSLQCTTSFHQPACSVTNRNTYHAHEKQGQMLHSGCSRCFVMQKAYQKKLQPLTELRADDGIKVQSLQALYHLVLSEAEVTCLKAPVGLLWKGAIVDSKVLILLPARTSNQSGWCRTPTSAVPLIVAVVLFQTGVRRS